MQTAEVGPQRSRQLPQHERELVAEPGHRIAFARERVVPEVEPPHVRQKAIRLHDEAKTRGRALPPAGVGDAPQAVVEARVNFDGVEALGVVREPVAARRTGIEIVGPLGIAPAASADEEPCGQGRQASGRSRACSVAHAASARRHVRPAAGATPGLRDAALTTGEQRPAGRANGSAAVMPRAPAARSAPEATPPRQSSAARPAAPCARTRRAARTTACRSGSPRTPRRR